MVELALLSRRQIKDSLQSWGEYNARGQLAFAYYSRYEEQLRPLYVQKSSKASLVAT